MRSVELAASFVVVMAVGCTPRHEPLPQTCEEALARVELAARPALLERHGPVKRGEELPVLRMDVTFTKRDGYARALALACVVGGDEVRPTPGLRRWMDKAVDVDAFFTGDDGLRPRWDHDYVLEMEVGQPRRRFDLSAPDDAGIERARAEATKWRDRLVAARLWNPTEARMKERPKATITKAGGHRSRRLLGYAFSWQFWHGDIPVWGPTLTIEISPSGKLEKIRLSEYDITELRRAPIALGEEDALEEVHRRHGPGGLFNGPPRPGQVAWMGRFGNWNREPEQELRYIVEVPRSRAWISLHCPECGYHSLFEGPSAQAQ